MADLTNRSDHELVDRLQEASISWRIVYADPNYTDRDKRLAECTKEIEELKAEIICRLGAVPAESGDESARRLTKEDAALFLGSRTSLDDIKASGWLSYASSSGRWWFKHKDRSTNFLPHWIGQLLDEENERGREEVRGRLRSAMGTEEGFMKKRTKKKG